MSREMRMIRKKKPLKCNLCNAQIFNEFVDGMTKSYSKYRGTWADMCLSCHGVVGVGLGLGKGQLYRRFTEGDDMFVKVEG